MGRRVNVLMVGVQKADGLKIVTVPGWHEWRGVRPRWDVSCNGALGYVFAEKLKDAVSVSDLGAVFSAEIAEAQRLWEVLRSWLRDRGLDLAAPQILMTCMEVED